MVNFFGVCLATVMLYVIKSTKTQIFTSVDEVDELFHTESVLINSLERYLFVQDNKMNFLKIKFEEYKRQHQVGQADRTLYLSNPINAYLLIRRLISDWINLENLISDDNGMLFLENITNYRNILKFPSEEDLRGAAVGLLRLQDTYNLETASVAKGELNGVQYSTEMTYSDCVEIAYQSYVIGDCFHSLLWMDEVMIRFPSEPKNSIDSITEAARRTLFELRDLISYDKNCICVNSDLNTFKFSEDELSKILCRDELKPTPSQLRPLRCHYVTNNVPFLKIAPLKRETASMSPFIVIYHDVMFDNEIELLKEMAKPLLTPAGVEGSSSGNVSPFRIAESAWIETKKHKIIQNIEQRTEDMTGLNMEAAEDLQVVNYGIGGHYVPHYDFGWDNEENIYPNDRIATVLFYMSDVEKGGATVFPAIYTSIYPKKGTAIFWYNLYASGEGDYRTVHGSCPVLIGSKWVSNKWIPVFGQEFKRPCDLNPDHPTYSTET